MFENIHFVQFEIDSITPQKVVADNARILVRGFLYMLGNPMMVPPKLLGLEANQTFGGHAMMDFGVASHAEDS
ncbi:hypothetical protein [Pseudomonas sp. Q1-7]|uniref:hypothetical protein n=1 Tax=Pseudomonas sp. Q1-7 TaxID=3020843 RepID=UPI0023017553|nr:hypothetical protein [Pseudomonas sp. Q1-7]